jgi:hypothetical protein
MPLKSIHNRNFGFIEQKMYSLTRQRVSSKKNSINWHHFYHKKYLLTFLELPPYMLMLVLHKDVLFHLVIFHQIKITKHNWDPCCHLVTDTGS